MTSEEYFRPGELITSRINSGDLSDMCDALRPIVDIGRRNGGVRFVEVDAYVSCRLHIVMNEPLPFSIEECLETIPGIEYFKYDYDPHFTLPDLDCFKCSTTGEVAAFPLTQYSERRTEQHKIGRYYLLATLIILAILIGVMTAIGLVRTGLI